MLMDKSDFNFDENVNIVYSWQILIFEKSFTIKRRTTIEVYQIIIWISIWTEAKNNDWQYRLI